MSQQAGEYVASIATTQAIANAIEDGFITIENPDGHGGDMEMHFHYSEAEEVFQTFLYASTYLLEDYETQLNDLANSLVFAAAQTESEEYEERLIGYAEDIAQYA